MFGGAIFFSLAIGSLTSLLSEMDKRNAEFSRKLTLLEQIHETYKLTPETMNKIRIAIKYDVYRSDDQFEELRKSLPEKLSLEFGSTIYKKKYQNVNLLHTKGSSAEFICAVGPCLNQLAFAEGDYIYNKGEYSNEIYFVQQGTVALVIQEFNNAKVLEVTQGGYFGEIELINNTPRLYTYQAQTEVSLLSMEKSHFIQIFLKDFKSIGKNIIEQANTREKEQRNQNKRVFEIVKEFVVKFKSAPAQSDSAAKNTVEVTGENHFAPKLRSSTKKLSKKSERRPSVATIEKNLLAQHQDRLQKCILEHDSKLVSLEAKIKSIARSLGMSEKKLDTAVQLDTDDDDGNESAKK